MKNKYHHFFNILYLSELYLEIVEVSGVVIPNQILLYFIILVLMLGQVSFLSVSSDYYNIVCFMHILQNSFLHVSVFKPSTSDDSDNLKFIVLYFYDIDTQHTKVIL